MMNVGKCHRCGAFLIGEQSESHTCKVGIKKVVDVYLEWITDGTTNDNGDLEKTALATDGTLYGFILCKHNPSHASESRWLTGKNESPQGNSTRSRNFYIRFFTCSNKSDDLRCLTNSQYQL
jgi:hypothetical protein